MDYNNFILSFLNCCELQKGLDAKTIKAYSIDLKQFSLFSSASPYESEKDLIIKISTKNTYFYELNKCIHYTSSLCHKFYT